MREFPDDFLVALPELATSDLLQVVGDVLQELFGEVLGTQRIHNLAKPHSIINNFESDQEHLSFFHLQGEHLYLFKLLAQLRRVVAVLIHARVKSPRRIDRLVSLLS